MKKLIFKYLDLILKDIKISENERAIKGILESNPLGDRTIFVYAKELNKLWVGDNILKLFVNMFDVPNMTAKYYMLEYTKNKFDEMSEIDIESVDFF
jgi:hypothetical protein